MLTLGAAPDSLSVVLVPGADFIAGLDSLDGPWPATASISLAFTGGTTWPAVIVGVAADWNVDKTAVDTLLASFGLAVGRVRLLYVDGTVDLLWATGSVAVRG